MENSNRDSRHYFVLDGDSKSCNWMLYGNLQMIADRSAIMFEDLRNSLSLMFSRGWPVAEASITRVSISPRGYGDLRVAYEFSLGNDGPYIGESDCPSYAGTDLKDINEAFKIGGTVMVRYKPTDPSVNKIDPSVWKDLEDSL